MPYPSSLALPRLPAQNPKALASQTPFQAFHIPVGGLLTAALLLYLRLTHRLKGRAVSPHA